MWRKRMDFLTVKGQIDCYYLSDCAAIYEGEIIKIADLPNGQSEKSFTIYTQIQIIAIHGSG